MWSDFHLPKLEELPFLNFHLFKKISLITYPNKPSLATKNILRCTVRGNNGVVDFGIWDTIKASDLICPTDLHVERVARKLKLIKRKQVDWQTATELTENLRQFDPLDPVKYDFALFGLGIEEHYQNEPIWLMILLSIKTLF